MLCADPKGQEGLAVASEMDKRCSTFMISFCLHGISTSLSINLPLKEQTDNANINFEFLFV
jgi:hypothetical protein